MKQWNTSLLALFADAAFLRRFARCHVPHTVRCVWLLIVVGAAMNIAAWIALPAVVRFAETASPLSVLLFAVATAGVLFATRFLWKYLDGVLFMQRDHLRMRANVLLAKCAHDDDATPQRVRSACGSHVNAPLPRSFQTAALLGAHLLGLVFCAVILGGNAALLLVVTTVATLLRAAAHFAVTAWDRRRSDEERLLDEQLSRVPAAVLSGRFMADIAVFSLRLWLCAVHDSAMAAMHAFLKRRCRMYTLFTVCDALLTLLASGAAYVLLVIEMLRGGMAPSAFLLVFAAIGGFSQSLAFAIDDVQTLVADLAAVHHVRTFLERGRKS